jgi:hypothetical protein
MPMLPEKVIITAGLYPENKKISGIRGNPYPLEGKDIAAGKSLSRISSYCQLITGLNY